MHEPLSAWESFYVIVGSSAAALTGLQFVVMTLIAGSAQRSEGQAISAFGTPTVVHFCAALLVSATLSAPWQHLPNAALAIGAFGVAGIAYTIVVTQRARRQSGYAPVLEDWIWHTALPGAAYSALLVAAIALDPHPTPMLFVIGGSALMLLFIGIHNSWDTVIYITLQGWAREHKQMQQAAASPLRHEDVTRGPAAGKVPEQGPPAGGGNG